MNAYFHAANLNDTFRLPYYCLWVNFVQGCTSLARQSSCRYSCRFTTRKMIQLRGIFRNASCHAAKHCLSVKNRPMVSLIIIQKFCLRHSEKHSSMYVYKSNDIESLWLLNGVKRQTPVFVFEGASVDASIVNQMIMLLHCYIVQDLAVLGITKAWNRCKKV